jgi:CRP-like cAMP-binding protein
MTSRFVDELGAADRAFAGNRLLSTFPAEARALIEPYAELVELAQGDNLFKPGDLQSSSIFPFAQTMVCLTVQLNDERSVEVASIGREGAIGGIVSCGHAPAFSNAGVLIGGPALKLPLDALEDAKCRSPYIAHVFCRFADYLLSLVMQSAACNAFHPITARAARWLLTAQDRAGDRIELTQEALASLLGVQRTTVNAVVGSLEEEGLINSRRGIIQVVDRAGLVRRACECYQAVEDHFTKVIGVSGTGPGNPC